MQRTVELKAGPINIDALVRSEKIRQSTSNEKNERGKGFVIGFAAVLIGLNA